MRPTDLATVASRPPSADVVNAINGAINKVTTKRVPYTPPPVAHISSASRKPIRTTTTQGPVRPPTRTPTAHSFLRGLRGIVTPIEGMDPRDFSSSYGPRIHPISHRNSFHTGIDISSPLGTPVLAPANAVVGSLATGDSIYGNQVVLAHNRRVDSMYGHLSRIAEGLEPGMKVRQGDIIGYVGGTGYSDGPHLHWETWRDGEYVNPMTFLGGG